MTLGACCLATAPKLQMRFLSKFSNQNLFRFRTHDSKVYYCSNLCVTVLLIARMPHMREVELLIRAHHAYKGFLKHVLTHQFQARSPIKSLRTYTCIHLYTTPHNTVLFWTENETKKWIKITRAIMGLYTFVYTPTHSRVILNRVKTSRAVWTHTNGVGIGDGSV